jgi:hypothetical protein
MVFEVQPIRGPGRNFFTLGFLELLFRAKNNYVKISDSFEIILCHSPLEFSEGDVIMGVGMYVLPSRTRPKREYILSRGFVANNGAL